jgi:hypothetical protein
MRRRKPKVVWLPATNTFSVDDAASSTWSLASVSITGAAAASGGVGGKIEVPIVQDGNTSDPLNPLSSLADIESSGYRLRRIVGKLYCFIAQTAPATEDLWGITAGFMVRRVDGSTGGSIAVAASAATNFNLIDPANIDNSMDPWIWRRSWLLSNYFTGTAATPLANNIFEDVMHSGGGTNYGRGYPGGNLEGPHVDQKTARIVGPEERLFLDVSATPIITANDSSLVIIYDLRVLASMRTNIGNRRNASR